MSYYTFIVPVSAKTYLIYNSISSALLEAESSQAHILYDWRKICRTSDSISPEELSRLDKEERDPN